MKILIIDDEPLVLKTIRLVLERDGHQVVEAENGETGLAAYVGHDFDIVAMDLLMPEKEGFETLQAIRARHPDQKILIITGSGCRGDTDALEMARRLGATATLRKPFDPDALVKIVAEMATPTPPFSRRIMP